MSEEDRELPGKAAYEAYCGYNGWKSLVSGSPLPPWPDLPITIQLAWMEAAGAARLSKP